MAFFGNYNNTITSLHDLNSKEEEEEGATTGDYNSFGNRNLDINNKFVDTDLNTDDPNCVENFDDAHIAQSENSEGNASVKLGKTAAPHGAWGSKFWKDCQPMSDSEYDRNNIGNEESGRNSSEESHEQRHRRLSQRGNVDIPADEMLSDDYYEQDGEEQSDSVHGSGQNHTNISGSRFPLKPVSVNKKTAKRSRLTKDEEYEDDEDYDEDDEDEDEGLVFLILPGT